MAPDSCEQRATGHFFVARTKAGGRQSQREGSHGLNSEQFTTRKLMSLGFRPARTQDAGSVRGRQQGYQINEHASDHRGIKRPKQGESMALTAEGWSMTTNLATPGAPLAKMRQLRRRITGTTGCL